MPTMRFDSRKIPGLEGEDGGPPAAPKATNKLDQAQSTWLVETLVHAAWVDGKVSPVEVALIERVMKASGWEQDAMKRAYRMLDGREAKPELKPPPGTFTYEQKVKVFESLVELVFGDGRLDGAEQELVMKMANTLSLHLSDMQDIWGRAKKKHDAARSK